MTAYTGACLQEPVILRLDKNIYTFYGVHIYITAPSSHGAGIAQPV